MISKVQSLIGAAAVCASALLVPYKADASVTRIDESAFTADAGLITFTEPGFPLGTTNPTYNPSDYGGGAFSPTVHFGGFFQGQSLGDASTCPAGAALTGCVIGNPTGPLTLDPSSPNTFITTDGSFPTSPTLSGTPQFNGPISLLFNVDVAGVGLEGGYFNSVGGTAITAFARDGSIIGQVDNEQIGIEFLGLVTNDGTAQIAGLQFSLVGDEPAGFNIDNVRFGTQGQVVPPSPVPVPAALPLMGGALAALGLLRRRKAAA